MGSMSVNRELSQEIPVEWITLADAAYPIKLGAFILESPGNILPGSFSLHNGMWILTPRYISFARPGIRCKVYLQSHPPRLLHSLGFIPFIGTWLNRDPTGIISPLSLVC
ncbi:unnamed protein product [Cuscuta epithymum]|uniref:Uncharacterized protein n=1 Tax=Cuscuta epithymum TaxID=186058 RepID=A0AAV0FPQ1_9ASTE|nr:unnamed protein product [Cuscuta epithymum]